MGKRKVFVGILFVLFLVEIAPTIVTNSRLVSFAVVAVRMRTAVPLG